MKKSNWIILAFLAVAAGFFLWLWYYLGFNFVDDPFDLVLAIAFWALVAAGAVGISKAEQARRRRIRTVYVGGHTMFNSERGVVNFEENALASDAIAAILSSLKYGFAREDLPDLRQLDVQYFVRTRKFDAAVRDAQDVPVPEQAAAASLPAKQTVGEAAAPTEKKEWEGEVVVVKTREERAFRSAEELAEILRSLGAQPGAAEAQAA